MRFICKMERQDALYALYLVPAVIAGHALMYLGYQHDCDPAKLGGFFTATFSVYGMAMIIKDSLLSPNKRKEDSALEKEVR